MSVAVPVIDHIDTGLKRIFLKTGVREYHPVTDIYDEVRMLRRTIEELRKYKMMVTAEGNKPKGGGKFTARYAIFNNGYRIVPADEDHALYISGEQITDDGQSGPVCIDTSLLSIGTNVTIHYEPPASELVRADAELEIISKAAYQGVITIDVTNGVAGTALPIGTHQMPVNNVTDAVAIANALGIEALAVRGSLLLTTGNNVSGLVLRGENAITTSLVIQPIANVANCQFEDIFISNSTFDGYTYVKHCALNSITSFAGYAEQCMLSGVIGVSDVGDTYFVDCKSGCVGLGTTDLPVFDISGIQQNIAFRNWSGPIKFINSTDTSNTICIDVTSGATVIIDSSCTAGTIIIRGISNLINNSTMTIDDAARIDSAKMVELVWSSPQASSVDELQKVKNLILATS